MTVYFFVGSEFSQDTNFSALNEHARALSVQDKPIERIIFYPCRGNDLDTIASHFKVGDVIIGASAGGAAAAQLVTKIAAHGKPKPIVIGFEPFGLEAVENVTTIVQADDPKSIINSNKIKHNIYQLVDNTSITVGGRQRYVLGHAFYAVHPSFIENLHFDETRVKKLTDSHYVLIPESTLNVGLSRYNYSHLVTNTVDSNHCILDSTLKSRAFHLGFINNIVRACLDGTLGETSLGNGFDVRLVSECPGAKVPARHPERSEGSLATRPELNTKIHHYVRNDITSDELLQIPSTSKSTNATNRSIKRLYVAIRNLSDYGTLLKSKGASKGQVATDLALQLKLKADDFFKNNSRDDLPRFKREFSNLLFSKNKEMREYRTAWGTIVKNIAIALTGIGALFIVGQLIYSKATEGRALFFFQKNKTTCEEKVEVIRQSISTCNMEIR